MSLGQGEQCGAWLWLEDERGWLRDGAYLGWGMACTTQHLAGERIDWALGQKERKKVRDGGKTVLRFKIDYNKVLPHISQNDHH